MILLEEDIETYVLFGIAPIYFIILSFLQAHYLKHLKCIEHRYTKASAKARSYTRIKRLKRTTPLYLLIGGILHTLAYLFFTEEIRNGYFLSIFIFYCIFAAVMYINFWLKGASILKDTVDFGGLPG